jgi:hypothetical protein
MHYVEAFRAFPNFSARIGYTDAFDPFKIMGIRSSELVHSRVLAPFLNKQKRHGLGAEFLNAFMTALARPDARSLSRWRDPSEGYRTERSIHALPRA